MVAFVGGPGAVIAIGCIVREQDEMPLAMALLCSLAGTYAPAASEPER